MSVTMDANIILEPFHGGYPNHFRHGIPTTNHGAIPSIIVNCNVAKSVSPTSCRTQELLAVLPLGITIPGGESLA